MYQYQTSATCCELALQLTLLTQNTCTVLSMILNMCLRQVSLTGNSWSLIRSLSVTFGGAPNFDVAHSFEGAYLGSFTNHALIWIHSKFHTNTENIVIQWVVRIPDNKSKDLISILGIVSFFYKLYFVNLTKKKRNYGLGQFRLCETIKFSQKNIFGVKFRKITFSALQRHICNSSSYKSSLCAHRILK